MHKYFCYKMYMHPNQMKPTFPTPSFKEPIVLEEQVEVTNDNNEIVMTN